MKPSPCHCSRRAHWAPRGEAAMILITGATGTVGSEIVKRLSAQGMPVRAVTRDPRKADAHRLPHVHFVHGDFEDVDAMRRACAGVDRAFLVTNSTART